MVTSSKFSDTFWGEKNNGFEVLCQNLKHSLNNVKELEAYFRECVSIEDQYSKLSTKLAQQSNKYSCSQMGTFNPIWQPFRELNERIAATHAQKVHQLNELIRETQRYADDLRKKIKKIIDNESQTQVCVQSFIEITQKVKITKEQYHSVALDFEKQKRAENGNLARLERKLKLNYDEYKLNIEKYNNIRADFERKLQNSCVNFHMAEENHLSQMKIFVENYYKLLISSNLTIQDINQDFNVKIDSLSLDYLLQTFIDNKKTGFERPQELSMIEPDFSKLPIPTLSTTLPSTSVNVFTDFGNLIDQQQQQPHNSTSNTTINSAANLIFNPPIGPKQQVLNSTIVGSSTSSSSSQDNMRRSDSKTTFNIFDVNPFFTKNRKKNANKTKKTKEKTLINPIAALTSSSPASALKDTSSIHSEDSVDKQNISNLHQNQVQQPPTSASLDFLEPMSQKTSNLSDVDSEGYSIRPDLKEQQLKKNNDDMTTLYPSSIDSDSDSDLEEGESTLIKKLVIKPKMDGEIKSPEANTNVLQEIGKSLQLNKIQLPAPTSKRNAYQISNKQLHNASTTTINNESIDWSSNNTSMTRSVSLSNTSQLDGLNEINFSSDQSHQKQQVAQKDLYNIDEDKEVESSFQMRRQSQLFHNQMNSTSLSNARYTPACFPSRTTPDFRHSASLFENTTRAITSPLTLHGSSVIPFAIAFNETIHAYFKLEDLTKYKIKCYGCMKISFPFAILKLISMELPELEFCLNNLQITDDLIINKSLIVQKSPMRFVFDSANLVRELKEQHQKNKQAAFFNFELLKYELKLTQNPPLLMYSNWHSLQHIDEKLFEIEFTLEYTFNFTKKFTNIQFMLILSNDSNEYQIQLVESEPQATVTTNHENEHGKKFMWQMSNFDTSGKLNAKFSINFMDSTKMIDQLDTLTQQPVYAKFQIDNTTLSHVKCDVLSSSYKVSLLKEKLESGKYFCTPQPFSSSTRKRDHAAGNISTQIGSSVDILLNI